MPSTCASPFSAKTPWGKVPYAFQQVVLLSVILTFVLYNTCMIWMEKCCQWHKAFVMGNILA